MISNVFDLFTGRAIGPTRMDSGTAPVSAIEARSDAHRGFHSYDGYCQQSLVTSLESRFESHQPRGGVLFTTPYKRLNGFNYIDSYGRGNAHNSKWQYKPKTRGDWNRPMPFPADINAIEAAFKKRTFGEFTLGYKSDPFMWQDMRYGTTKETLRLARVYGIRLTIETMSDLVAGDAYIALLSPYTTVIVMNMGGGESEEQERIDSPGAPSIKRRLAAVDKLKENGYVVRYRVKGELLDIYKRPNNVKEA